MRGTDYFTRDDEREWQRLYDRAVSQFIITKSAGRNPRNFDANPMIIDDYDAVYLDVTRSNEYSRWREDRDRQLEGERVFWRGVDPLNVDKLSEVRFDRPRLAPFKIKYDTLEEVRMRFHKTVILVKGNPFYVADQRIVKDQFYLLLEDPAQKKAYVQVDDIPDFRSAPPGYVKLGDTNGYMKRLPSRQNQQGMNSQSISIKAVGSNSPVGFNGHDLVSALACRSKTLPWDTAFRRLIDDRIVSTFRLSDQLALYKKPTQEAVLVEYKGRRLGELHDHTIKLFDEDDVIQPWVKSDARKVNLEVSL